MKTIKQISLWFFALMAITSVTNGVWAADFKVGQLYYEILSATEVAVCPENGSSPYYNAGNKPTGDITIPATVIDGGTTYNVTLIGAKAFFYCSSLTSVVIPSSVEYIASSAFRSCTALTSVTIPASVTTIGERAFYNCTALTSVTIPEGVTKIEYCAFCKCTALTSVTIPSSVTTIEDGAFVDCSTLTAITVVAGNTVYLSDDGVLYNKAKTTLIQYPAGKTETSFTIPASVTTIGKWAFSGCSALTSITIPASVTTIKWGAFSGCSALTLVTIPASVTAIGDEAFEFCTALTLLTVNWTTAAAIPAIDSDEFDDVTLSGVTLSVPTGTKSLYEAKAVWQDFNIVEGGVLSVSPATLTMAAGGETKPITVTSNAAWTASSSETWLTISPASGTNSGTITATAAPNTSTAPRTATVTVTAGSLIKTLTVMQAGTGVNMSRYITLAVKSGEGIKFKFKAAVSGTTIKVKSGATDADVTVGTDWTAEQIFTADDATMTVYGDLTGFDCTENGTNLTALDVTQNTLLEVLKCAYNRLTALDVTQHTQLKSLHCYENYIAVLDVTQNTQLDTLYCRSNKLTALDVTQNTGLKILFCESNDLTALDVTQNTQLKSLKCADNQIADLDVTQNTQLKSLYCYKNNFSTDALNRIYCGLPDRTSQPPGWIYPAYDTTDPNHAAVLVTAASNATGKNWNVKYRSNNANIPTTGTYDCSTSVLIVSPTTLAMKGAGEAKSIVVTSNAAWTASSSETWLTVSPASGTNSGTITATAAPNTSTAPRTATVTVTSGSLTETVAVTQAGILNMSRYITLTVKPGEDIKLRFKTSDADTPIKVKSGATDADITVGTDWTVEQTFNAGNATMTVYGNLTGFVCSRNGANLTALDVTQNTQLEHLDCSANRLTTLDIRQNTQLDSLDCSFNKLTALDVTQNTQLKRLNCRSNLLATLDIRQNTQLDSLVCSFNKLTVLDVTQNTQLESLDCSANDLTALDVTQNTQLKRLDCSANSLTELNVTKNTELERLECDRNNFLTVALDRIYCALPDRTSKSPVGVIVPAYDNTDSGHAAVLATNAANATGKNWKVVYGSGGSDIPATGTYNCGSIVSPATLNMVSAGETQPITVTSSTAWTASSSETWLTLSPANGTGNGVIQATAEANAGVVRTATVTVKSGSKTQTVTVTQAGEMLVPEFVVLDHTDITLPAGGSMQLNATVYPETDKVSRKVSWYSINKSIATVNGSGTVTGICEGVTSILAVTEVGERRTQCRVRVVSDVSVNPVGETLRVYAFEGRLHISLPEAQTVRIYNVSGALVKELDLPAGDTSHPLPTGFYIVRLGTQVKKVIVK